MYVLACRLQPLALIGAGWHADDALEVAGQVRLVGEAGLRCDIGWRESVVEQQPCPADPQLIEVGVRRQAGSIPERPQQRELT